MECFARCKTICNILSASVAVLALKMSLWSTHRSKYTLIALAQTATEEESSAWCSRNTSIFVLPRHAERCASIRENWKLNERWRLRIKASELNWATLWHVRRQLLMIYTLSIWHMLQVQNDSLFIRGCFLHCIDIQTICVLLCGCPCISVRLPSETYVACLRKDVSYLCHILYI